MNRLFILAIGILLITSCAQNASTGESENVDSAAIKLQTQAAATFGTLPDTAFNVDNPITAEKVLLGKTLYFDNRLSRNEVQSCNSCHNLATYGVDNLPTSPGNDGVNGTRNSPTTIHSAFQFVQFWDGRNKDVEEQAGGPVMNPVEMGMPDEKLVIERLSNNEGYKTLFAKAFPDDENPISFDNVRKAIGAFERTLMPKAPFDSFLAGDLTAIDSTAKLGLQTFINKGCIACHIGPGVGGGMFQKFALYGNYWDYTHSNAIDSGRVIVTKNPADLYVFKTSMLRNIEKTYPYFHDGSVKELKEAIKIMGKTELNQDLSDEEIQNIEAFLITLTSPLNADQIATPTLP